MNSLNHRQFFKKLLMITAIFSLILLFFLPGRWVGSFSIGCLVMLLNFYSLFHLLEGIMEGGTGKVAAFTALLTGKFLILAAAIYGLYRFLNLDLLAFGIGFFIVAISATYATSGMQKQ
ncbi:MAG: ATP synthase subunit I [Bdellovibrionota bacterium]